MHKAYQPFKPATNRYLQKKWDHAHYKEHRKKVENAKPVVDTKGFETPSHVQLKLKKLQIQEEKLAIIERDNHLLSSRLATIMLSKGLIDHRNPSFEHSSLNNEKRRKKLLEVSGENQAMLQRLSACESDYRRQQWEDNWKRIEQQRDDIAKYPRGLTKKST
ncbi:uncharacterized protein CFAP97D2 [Engraulis encrasicolus]|uniref:uncharacterized protein CFAP97D2 n=1 Tax=Engraulis encrasicolus TaxID=184585 RepID=UPI002FCEE811